MKKSNIRKRGVRSIHIKKRISLGAVCLLSAAFLLSGCSGDPAATSQSKELTIGSAAMCTTLDPVLNFDGWFTVRFGIGETLTRFDDDFSVSGWLASDYTASDDYTVWTFTLRDDVAFSDGTKLTAGLAASSIENVFENGTRGEDYFTCTDISADGQILTITTADPEPILPSKLADPLFVIINTETDMTDIATDGPVGTGPFKVSSFDPATKETVVVRNENYWDGDVALDQITFLYTGDQSTLTMGMKAGDFDAVYNISMSDISEFEDSEEYEVIRCAGGRTTHGFMNQNGVLGDEALRRAILRCIDRESFCENLLDGQYIPGKTLLTSASDYGYDELTDINAYDPEGAVSILDNAGYTDLDGDGFRETPEGEKLDITFIYYSGRPEQEILVEATQMECAKAGIRITPRLLDSQTVMDRLAAGDYEMCCVTINVLSNGDPEDHLRTYFSTGGYYNQFGYSNPDFDATVDELSVTSNSEERTRLVKEAEQILMDDTACIYFCYPVMNFVTVEGVTGINCTPADFYWVNADTGWRTD